MKSFQTLITQRLVSVINEAFWQLLIKGAVSRNSAKLGNYQMPVKLRET